MGLMQSGIINRVASIGVVMKFRIYGIACLIGMLAGSASLAQIQQGPLWDKAPNPIWTEHPVRVDRKKQDFERIAGPVDHLGVLIKVPRNVRVNDSATFSIGGSHYVIKAALPIPPRKLCRNLRGHIVACGQQARAYLRKLIQGRTLRCYQEFLAQQAWMVDCHLGGRALAQTLVSAGAAFAATASMLELERTSQMMEKGIWSDANCQIGICK